MIPTDDDWSGILGIMGFGRDKSFPKGTDLQTILSTDVSDTVNVLAQSTPAIGTDTLSATNGAELGSSMINVSATEFLKEQGYSYV